MAALMRVPDCTFLNLTLVGLLSGSVIEYSRVIVFYSCKAKFKNMKHAKGEEDCMSCFFEMLTSSVCSAVAFRHHQNNAQFDKIYSFSGPAKGGYLQMRLSSVWHNRYLSQQIILGSERRRVSEKALAR